MLQSKAKWNSSEYDESTIQHLVETLRISPLIAKLLVVRGIKSSIEAEQFLHMDVERFHDPFLLDGMQLAVERIQLAILHKQKIRIYGDYDADGVSSTALMILLLRQLQASFDYYIPHRLHEGYGLNREAINHASKNGISLIVTVDTGISAVEEVKYASELGIDVIITDHHQPPENLPQALVILNPKKTNCLYPFKQLAGVGVAFKLAHALLGRLPVELLEMAALGTIADLMPLLGENRLLVKLGLERFRTSASPGLKALMSIAGVERRTVSATHIGYSLAPRINAGGRLESADPAVRLLTTDNEQEAEHLAFDLDMLNKERQRIVEEMTKDAFQLAAEDAAFHEHKVIVLAKENWNVGVIGIVASRMLDKFYRPAIILGIDPQTGLAKGSARSIAGFDLYKALSLSADLFQHYGGHQAAAGMTIHRDDIPELQRRLGKLAGEWLSAADFVPTVQADMVCDLQEMPLEAIQQMELLAPFGMGNPVPKFIFRDLKIDEIKTMGREQQHLKFTLTEVSDAAVCSIEAIAFGRGRLMTAISSTGRLDVFGELSVNEWNGMRKPQLLIQDMAISHVQLFDWRGTKDFEKKWLESETRSLGVDQPLALTVRQSQVGIVLFSEKEEAMLPPAVLRWGCPIWHINLFGSLIPLNSAAIETPISQIQDIIYYFLPTNIHQLKVSLASAIKAERIYALFNESIPSQNTAIPARDLFKTVFATIQQRPNSDMNRLTASFSKRSGLTPELIRFILDVFVELGFITQHNQLYSCTETPAKKELSSSPLYQQRLHRQEVEQLLLYCSAQELSDWMLPQVALPLVKAVEAMVL